LILNNLGSREASFLLVVILRAGHFRANSELPDRLLIMRDRIFSLSPPKLKMDAWQGPTKLIFGIMFDESSLLIA
jgi:hypothetical protein